MEFKIKNKTVELGFTFRSFKILKDFSFNTMNQMEDHPFYLIQITEDLLYGAVNKDKKDVFSKQDVEDALDDYCMENSLAELFKSLMELMQESDFFKQLQTANEEAPKE